MKIEGIQPYAPSRIEWLTLLLQADNTFQYNFLQSIPRTTKGLKVSIETSNHSPVINVTNQNNGDRTVTPTQFDVSYQGIPEENTIIIKLYHTKDIESETIKN